MERPSVSWRNRTTRGAAASWTNGTRAARGRSPPAMSLAAPARLGDSASGTRGAAMGKVVVSQFISLDGVVEDPGGSEEWERGGWAFKFDRGSEGDGFKLDEVMAS